MLKDEIKKKTRKKPENKLENLIPNKPNVEGWNQKTKN